MKVWPKITLLPSPNPILAISNRFSSTLTTYSITRILHNKQWLLPNPSSPINEITISTNSSSLSFSNNSNPALRTRIGNKEADCNSFFVIRDDLLHPLVNGNKARKLDALIPILKQNSITDVITCGGCQSAHTAALAVACAERGIKSHLLLRGERPEIPTGYNLVSLMYGNVVYIPREKYACREDMFERYAKELVGSGGCVVDIDDIVRKASEDLELEVVRAGNGIRSMVVVSEGAGDAVALLGVIRLVKYLSEDHVFGKEEEISLIVDAGTGTTAVGLALGALSLGLPWKVTAIMLADTVERYKEKERGLISDFKNVIKFECPEETSHKDGDGIVNWVERLHPRKFGKVMKGEIDRCREISQQTGILLDPVYTLAAWDQSVVSLLETGKRVVMLHTGGTLGLFGLAQRYTSQFYVQK